MRALILFICLQVFCLSKPAHGQHADVIIRNVNYVDVIEEKVKRGDILIRDQFIEVVANDLGARRAEREIDGTDKWLVPGLVDAHIHLFQSGGIYTRPDVIDLTNVRPYEEEVTWLKENASDLLERYLRCGITTVIDAGGPMTNFEIRDQFKDRASYPNLFVTGPLISTYQPEAFKIEDPPIVKANSQSEAIELVRAQLPFKPDFLKVWYISLPNQSAESTFDIVKVAIDESHSHGLRVAVHATELNTAKLAIKAGADVLVHSVDDPVDDEFLLMLEENEVTYIPTLNVHGNYVETFMGDIRLSEADFNLSNPIPTGSLLDLHHLSGVPELEAMRPYLPGMKAELVWMDSIRKDNLLLLSQLPIAVATGTDAGNIGTLHATSYYDEMAAMAAAGLSNMEILVACTINGAKMIGKEHLFGSIEEGKWADMLVLNANPLERINAVQEIDYVISGGHVLDVDSFQIDTPEDLVQRQLNGYNRRDINAFLAPYDEDVELYDFPGQINGKGKENIRSQYAAMFKRFPDLHCELVNRIISGNTVIDHEKISGIPNEDDFEAIVIYKIDKNKITKVYFVQE